MTDRESFGIDGKVAIMAGGGSRESVVEESEAVWENLLKVNITSMFLASERARFITGQTLVVDGGATLIGPKRE
jgi:enoyl-[acyl-carrier-protein] reductase (NADH)